MQVEQKEREIEQSGQIEVEESDAYSLFVYAVRSQVTRDYYLRRLSTLLQDRNSANISYFCNACNIQTNLEETDNLRKRSRLQMPEGVNTTPYASTKFPEYTVNKQPQEIHGSFKTLQNRGMRIKNYKDSVKNN